MTDQHRSPFIPLLIGTAVIAATVQTFVLWGTDLPLGIPHEWTWPRVPWSSDLLTNLWPAILMGGILLSYLSWMGHRLQAWSWPFRWIAVTGLSLCGILWIFSLLSAIPSPSGLERAPFVLYFERSSGYYTQSLEIRDLTEFWSSYDERIADRDLSENYLHLGTHPPGLTTGFVLFRRLCESVPFITQLVSGSRPEGFERSLDVIAGGAGGGQTLTEIERSVLWLATLTTIIAAALATVPLFFLCQRHVSIEAAWWTTSFWLLVPAVGVFLPKSDVIFPALTVLAQWLWLEAFDRRSFTINVLTGLTMFLATFLSLAFVPLGLILVLQAIIRTDRRGWLDSSFWFPVGGAFLGFALPIGLLWGIGGLNLPLIWIRNLTNHAAFYDHHTRSYWPWLLENPVELSFALGMPLSVCTATGAVLLLRMRKTSLANDTLTSDNRETEVSLPPLRKSELLVPIVVWGILWISGKNMGETARLWILLMPYAVWMSAVTIERLGSSLRAIMAVWILQAVVGVLTVVRIDGFHFSEFAS